MNMNMYHTIPFSVHVSYSLILQTLKQKKMIMNTKCIYSACGILWAGLRVFELRREMYV